MEYDFDSTIIKTCLFSQDSIIIESEKEKFEKKIKENREKAKWVTELNIANKEIALQSEQNADQAVQLIIANKELATQIREKADRAAELIIANKELAFQNEEKAKRAVEFGKACKKLAFELRQKSDRASELVDAKKELEFQSGEKADRASELIIANKELAFQIGQKADRAVELIIANKELSLQSEENAHQAAELITANKELAFQNVEKADREAELIIANKELAFQNEEKGKRAAELVIANKKLIIANKELALQSKQNSQRAEELIIANKTQGEYFVNISHELKTPLNVICATAQLFDMYCKNGSLDQKKKSILEYNHSIKQNCYRLSKLINNIVDLSKIEAGFFKLNLSNNNIVEVVEKMVTSVTVFTRSKDLSIVFDTNVEEKIIACDSEKIERIVLNLISNAIKFSDKGDEIFVQVTDKNEFVEISVKDNGIGIEQKDLNVIFDRFNQVDKSLSRNSEGTGIGLSLVKSIVELHGGSIHVESEVGKGSKFTVMLPSENVSHENMIYNRNMKNGNENIEVELSDVYL